LEEFFLYHFSLLFILLKRNPPRNIHTLSEKGIRNYEDQFKIKIKKEDSNLKKP